MGRRMRWAASSGLQLARLHSSSLRAPTNGLRAGRWAHDESAFERATHYAARVAATRLRFLGLQGTRAGSEQAVRAWMTAGERWPPRSWEPWRAASSSQHMRRSASGCVAQLHLCAPPSLCRHQPCWMGMGHDLWALGLGPLGHGRRPGRAISAAPIAPGRPRPLRSSLSSSSSSSA